MKMVVIFMTVFAMQSFAASGQTQMFNINLRQATIEDVLNVIEEESDYYFFFKGNEAELSNTNLDVNFENSSLGEILEFLLQDTRYSFKIIENYVAIAPKESVTQQSEEREVRGTVVDTQGEPIPGATVTVKGTTQGTITDMNGRFTLTVPEGGEALSFSFIGMRTQEMTLGSQVVFDVVLKEEVMGLDEVVVVGYGTQKKINLTGAVNTVTADEIENRPVSSAASVLQGVDPSVNLTFGSGVLDSDYNIDIRGVASINGGSPLVLADGIEVSLNQINPKDIESISVLKDASSSAIYGAKASSGVILITTKKGKNTDGKAIISYNGRFGVSQNTTSTDFIRTGYDHVNVVNTFYEVYKGTPMAEYSESEMEMLYDRRNDMTEHPDRPWVSFDNDGRYMYYGNFDWYNYYYRQTRPEQEHNVSFTGGNDKIDYFISGRYLNEEGVFDIYDDNYERYSFRAKLSAEITPWLKYSNNVNYSSSDYQYAGYYDEQFTIRALQSNTLATFVPRNPDGTIMQYPNQLSANSPIGAGHGGFITANEARNSRKHQYLILSNKLDAEVTDDLVLTASYAYSYHNRPYTYRSMPFDYSRKLGETQTFNSGSIYDYYQESFRNTYDHNVNVYGTYENTWNNHNLTVVAGSQYEDYRTTFLRAKQRDLLSESLSSFSVGTGETELFQEISAFRTLGFFGRVNYDYKGKYLLEMSGRWDGTSRFSANDRWGFFPSASAGWRISEEDFWAPLKSFWNSSKLRFSVGSLGNQQVDYYAYIDEISADNTMSYTFDGSSTGKYASVSNPISSALTWETVTMYNVGLDFSFLRGKLSLTSDYYIRETKDMLTPSLTLPSVYGANTPLTNNADLQTKGWEIQLRWNDSFELASKDFKYNAGFTIGDYQTEITKFHNPDRLISDFYEGMTMGEIWGYKVDGLFASDETAANYQAEIDDKAVNHRVYSSKIDNNLRAGDVKFIDLNGDKIINEGSGTVDDPGDKRIIGNSLPRYSYSFNLGASWNGFDVSAFFQGVGKQDWYPTTYAYDFWGPYSFPSLSFIHEDFVSNYWTEENPDSYFPRPRGYASYSSGALGVENDRYLQDVSYLRLKNITLGYTLPVKNSFFQKVRVYATAENPFYWSKLKKNSKTVDPELANSTSTYNSRSGVGYPYSKSYSIGVDITF